MKWQDLNYRQQVEFVIKSNRVREAGEYNHTNDIKVCETPKYLIKYGFKPLPMFYTKRHLLSAVKNKEFQVGTIHDVSLETMLKIPEVIKNPIAIMKSHTRNDSIVIVTSLLSKDKAPLIITIQNGGFGWVDNNKVNANFITSMYGKDHDFQNYIDIAARKGTLLYCNKMELAKLLINSNVTIPRYISNEYRIVKRMAFANKNKQNKKNIKKTNLTKTEHLNFDATVADINNEGVTEQPMEGDNERDDY